MSLPSPLQTLDAAQTKTLLMRFGPVGQAVIEASRGVPANERLAYCKSELVKLAQAVKQSQIYTDGKPPVGFREFVEDPTLLNMKGVLYPKVLDAGFGHQYRGHLHILCCALVTQRLLLGKRPVPLRQ